MAQLQEPVISIETISAEAAKSYLSVNGTNRPIGKTTVDTYMGAMRRGEWMLNGESIKFSVSGKLIDGQHRLTAVARTGIPIRCFVMRGVQDNAFETLDIGKKRLGSDTLAIHGEKNTATLAAATRWFNHITGKVARHIVTPAAILKAVETHPQLRYWTQEFDRYKTGHFMPSLFVGVIAAAHEKYPQETLHVFLRNVSTGVGLSDGDPALILRNRFMERRARGQTFSQDAQLTYCIKALNAYLSNKKIGFLRFSRDEEIPEIV